MLQSTSTLNNRDKTYRNIHFTIVNMLGLRENKAAKETCIFECESKVQEVDSQEKSQHLSFKQISDNTTYLICSNKDLELSRYFNPNHDLSPLIFC